MNTWNYAAGGRDWFIGAEWDASERGSAFVLLSGCIENINALVSSMVRNVLAMDMVNESRQDGAEGCSGEDCPVVIDSLVIDLTGCWYIDSEALFVLAKAALAMTGAGGRAALICTAESFAARKVERVGLGKYLLLKEVMLP